MSRAKELMEKTEKYAAHNYKPLPLVLDRGEGVWVWDVDGNKYLDMLSSYSALNHGHRHPKIINAAKQQLDKLTLTSRAFYCDKLSELSEKLCNFAGFDMVLFMNSGAEAVETAVKLVRKWGYKIKKVPKYEAEIIVCANNFHGRTTTVISFSTEELYKDDFGPFTPGFKVIPYGDINALKSAITKNTVAFLVEPIQGEGGIIVPPSDYLKEAKKLCNQNKVLFVLDEIQTGMGRTGKNFCYEWDDAKPDVLVIGKALGGGLMPISGVLSSKEVMNLFVPGEHGSTFGGNPLACAIAISAIDVMIEENLSKKSNESGQYLVNKLREIKSPHIKEVRGRGLLIGIELNKEAGGARKFCEKLMSKGMLCKETHDHVIRLAPPLVIEKSDLDWAIERIKEVLC